jgi:hypothetical protein
MGLVTVFCPLTTTGAGQLVLQFVGKSFAVDCNVNLAGLAGHAETTLVPGRVTVSWPKTQHRQNGWMKFYTIWPKSAACWPFCSGVLAGNSGKNLRAAWVERNAR